MSQERSSFETIELSWDSLEEDLSQIDYFGMGSILSGGERKAIIKDGCNEVLNRVGKFVVPGRIASNFPGLDVEDIESYDFSGARLRSFIVPAGIFGAVVRATDYCDQDESSRVNVAGFARGYLPKFMTILKHGERLRIVDKSGRVIIAVKELVGSKTGEVIKKDIKYNVRHEVLHSLGVGLHLNKFLEELVVDYYALETGVSNESQRVAYGHGVFFVEMTLSRLKEMGLEQETIDKALISGDQESLNLLMAKVVEIYGQEDARRIVEGDFENMDEYFEFLRNFEGKW